MPNRPFLPPEDAPLSGDDDPQDPPVELSWAGLALVVLVVLVCLWQVFLLSRGS
ncbi:MAG: hypothetical protein M3Q03_17330 [Chloroflexota bacterium]|nr:hypothetical protein [Chloroflexota bacterium]